MDWIRVEALGRLTGFSVFAVVDDQFRSLIHRDDQSFCRSL